MFCAAVIFMLLSIFYYDYVDPVAFDDDGESNKSNRSSKSSKSSKSSLRKSSLHDESTTTSL